VAKARIGIVLAAGKGTRLKSTLPKVLHPVLGKSMLQRVLESFVGLGLDRVILVIGHQAQQVQQVINTFDLPFPIDFVIQEPQLGTGHAVMQILPILPPETDAEVLITCGDMPLVKPERYQHLLKHHAQSQAAVTLVTVSMSDPTGYGRVIWKDGIFQKIVEQKDASPEEYQIPWVNAGIYAAEWPALSRNFSKLTQNNAQGEFYLTDVMGLMVQTQGAEAVRVETWPDQNEVLGINSRQQLSEAVQILSLRTAHRLMDEGVSLINPDSMTLAPEVSIGPDTVLYPGCVLEGTVQIGSHCEIGPYTTMSGEISVADHCRIIYSLLDRVVTVGKNSYLGPFAHCRDNAILGETVRIGNFVEVKEARIGDRSNAAHLSYVGDADIGNDVNMGAGSIIANYDPILDKKYRSTIEDGVKVGCNTVLISPITLRERSCVAAGSVITEDVAPWDLAIARSRQTSISQWVEQKLT
jgi:bifunctional UDP-N-acetylglucosamine pyrophosphorylase / glucosamine-1-phosphate N-acetyltransferase